MNPCSRGGSDLNVFVSLRLTCVVDDPKLLGNETGGLPMEGGVLGGLRGGFAGLV